MKLVIQVLLVATLLSCGNCVENVGYPDKPPAYSYKYEVDDKYTGSKYSADEDRKGDLTSGSYTVLLPDGRTKTVTYSVKDYYSGFVADVSYSGTPIITYSPQPSKYVQKVYTPSKSTPPPKVYTPSKSTPLPKVYTTIKPAPPPNLYTSSKSTPAPKVYTPSKSTPAPKVYTPVKTTLPPIVYKSTQAPVVYKSNPTTPNTTPSPAVTYSNTPVKTSSIRYLPAPKPISRVYSPAPVITRYNTLTPAQSLKSAVVFKPYVSTYPATQNTFTYKYNPSPAPEVTSKSVPQEVKTEEGSQSVYTQPEQVVIKSLKPSSTKTVVKNPPAALVYKSKLKILSS